MDKPVVFAVFDYYRRFAPTLRDAYPGATVGAVELRRFPNGELHAKVQQNVEGRDCLVVGSTAPPDEQLLMLVTLTDTLKRAGARTVRAFLPYLGYSRQDAADRGASGGIALIGALLRCAGVDDIVTVDIHSDKSGQRIGLPCYSIPSADLFADDVRKLGWDDAVFVAPDKGARDRTNLLARTVGNTHPIVHLVKTHSDGVQHIELVGSVDARVILVDDILDTGQTFVSACELLQQQGVTEIAVVVTHGLFTGNIWRKLFSLGVTRLIVSDSCPDAGQQSDAAIQVVSIAPLCKNIDIRAT